DDAGAEVLDQDVGLGDQRLHGRDVGWIFEVCGEAEFAAINGVEERGIAADLGVGKVKAAAEITSVWPLDLDDPRAEVAEAQGGEWPRQELAHVEDEQPLQQRLAHRLHSPLMGAARYDGR